VVFTASAAAYSRLARGVTTWIPWDRFLIGAFTSLVFFLWLRILDEHKDAAQDRAARPELPVPRGLVSLGELRAAGLVLLVAAVLLNLLAAPALLGAMLVVAGYMALMTREFFVPTWLRSRPVAYLLSHMMIMPLIDGYTTGLDWLAERVDPPVGIWFFLAVTFMNGVIVEIGRKIRAPADERPGVDTYTKAWGVRRAPMVWLGVLAATTATTWLALRHVGGGAVEAVLLVAFAALAALPAIRFVSGEDARSAKRTELAAGLWTIAVYLLLGVGRFVAQAIGWVEV
jgi:4-hydroxybenzoate polyprenyltransferase